ncbi:unnamed protein product [Cuscuta epithymum]|uniref:Uncharacterized protein n=1 Tax=Cuscuta epithymum TaxID=186058 RepID=A0AAV0DGU5_9ASTE|nr:unnamed protein product [Cuscuta epithymum]
MDAIGTEDYALLYEQYLLREKEEKLKVGTKPAADVVKTFLLIESSPVIPSAIVEESSVVSANAVSSEDGYEVGLGMDVVGYGIERAMWSFSRVAEDGAATVMGGGT